MELIKEPLKINQAVKDESMQFSVQGDTIIPDIKPDVGKVLYIDANISIDNKEAMQDRAEISGNVAFDIIYLSSDEERQVRGVRASLPFREEVESKDIKNGMKLLVDACILNKEYSVINERKIFIKAVVQLDTKAYDIVDTAVISDITGEDDIEKLSENYKICSFLGETSSSCNAKEEVELPENNPPIFEVLSNTARVVKEVSPMEDKLMIKGDVIVTTLYSADDEEGSIMAVESEIPFSQAVDIYGVDGETLCDTEVKIKEMNVKPVEDEAGDFKVLDYDIDLEIEANAFAWQDGKMIVDAYSQSKEIDMENKDINSNQMVLDLNSQIVVKDTVEVPEDEKMNKIYSCVCNTSITNTEVGDKRISVSGILDVTILYAGGEDNSTRSARFEIPYNGDIESKDINNEMNYRVNAEVGQCGVNMVSETECEVRAVICIDLKLYSENRINIINRIESNDVEKTEEEGMPSVVLYYVKPGDTLWMIGKKYRITVDELVQMNNIQNPDELSIGQQILIPKRVMQKEFKNK